MPAGLTIRHAAAAAGLALAVLPLSAVPGHATGAEPDAGCTAAEVTVVVDYNELGGGTRVACAEVSGSASQAFDAAGFPLTYTRAPGMQGFVCTVTGLPRDERCTAGDAYWSLWWSDAGGSAWTYATLGADQLEVGPGDHVGFAWHQGEDDAAPPDVPIAADGTLDTGSGDDVAAGAPDPGDSTDRGEGAGFPTWAAVGLGVVVLGAAGAVPLLRRRSP